MVRNRLGFIVGLLLIVSVIVALPVLASKEKTTYQDPDTGVVVELNREEEVFPESWRSAPINGKAEALDKSQYERSWAIIKQALDKYPVELVKRNLEKVYFFSA